MYKGLIIKINITILSVLFILASCTSVGNSERINTEKSVTNDVFLNGNEIYIAGKLHNKAVYWKNGTRVDLETEESEANSIFVSNDVVYAGGSCNDSPCYWKNNERIDAVSLTKSENKSIEFDTTKYISSIYINENDVYYVIKNESTQKQYYKNGSSIILNDGSDDIPVKVKVFNNDVYILGEEGYWKNGIYSYVDSELTDFCISGDPVYSCGQTWTGDYIPFYYKDNDKTLLTSPYVSDFYQKLGFASSIAVNNSDVYVSGHNFDGVSDMYLPCYWKNGEMNLLPNNNRRAFTTGIIINADIIFVTGLLEDKDATKYACYWENGILNMLE